jgi:hypothetical protein
MGHIMPVSNNRPRVRIRVFRRQYRSRGVGGIWFSYVGCPVLGPVEKQMTLGRRRRAPSTGRSGGMCGNWVVCDCGAVRS